MSQETHYFSPYSYSDSDEYFSPKSISSSYNSNKLEKRYPPGFEPSNIPIGYGRKKGVYEFNEKDDSEIINMVDKLLKEENYEFNKKYDAEIVDMVDKLLEGEPKPYKYDVQVAGDSGRKRIKSRRKSKNMKKSKKRRSRSKRRSRKY